MKSGKFPFSTKPRQRPAWPGVALALGLFCLLRLNVPALDVGTPFHGPHAVPGTIEAEDFNAGANHAAYYAETVGNQGNATYRTGIDADLYQEGTVTYVRCSKLTSVSEFLNYTFEVAQGGWYKIVYRAKSVGSYARVATLIDDRGLGESDWLPYNAFGDITVVKNVRLTAGAHLLKIAFRIPDVCIDSITVSSADPPAGVKPTLIDTAEESVVASAVVTASPFGADNTGAADATAPIQQALNVVAGVGGGVVFVPAGQYKILGTLGVPGNVTLMGDWESPLKGGSGRGTILMAYAGRGNENAKPFITLAEGGVADLNAAVRNLSIWYPEQTAADIQPYPFAIRTASLWTGACEVEKITLYNAYNGIRIDAGGAHAIGNIYGTCLRRGIVAGHGYEFAFMNTVALDGTIWSGAARDVITNAPQSPAEVTALDRFTSDNLVGVQLGKDDGHMVYGVTVKAAKTGVLVQRLEGDEAPFWGMLTKVDATIEEADPYVFTTYPAFAPQHFINTDLVPETQAKDYAFASMRKPARTGTDSLFNVMDYGATGNGTADDGPAIQQALDAAGKAGGGTVHLTQGQYRVDGHLTVPAGIELRGPCGHRNLDSLKEPCVLLAYEGRNSPTARTDPAFITLGANAGVRGLRIAYPEQGFGSVTYPVASYPWTIRGAGIGVWVIDVTLLNAYDFIDLASNRCDQHLVAGVWGTVFDEGIRVGGGSQDGRLERIVLTYGMVAGSLCQNAPRKFGLGDLSNYTFNHTRPYRIGDCVREASFGLCSFFANIHMTFADEGQGGCKKGIFWQAASDVAMVHNFLVEGGESIDLIGPLATTDGWAGRHWLYTAPSFTGTLNVLDQLVRDEGPNSPVLEGGTVNLLAEQSLVTGAPVTASAFHSEAERPERATDRAENTKWVDVSEGAKWLEADLGQPCEIARWRLRNAGVLEPQAYNTRAADLEWSLDGVIFTKADGVTTNTYTDLDRALVPRSVRTVRLKILEGAQPGQANVARLPEFLVYGRPGWQFSHDAENWTKGDQVSDFSTGSGRLNVLSTGGDPRIFSPDHLNIDLARFNQVRILARNETSSSEARLAFITNVSPAWDDAKSSSISTLTPNDGRFREVVFDFSGDPAWSGTLQQLRLTPARGAGRVSIEAIWLGQG